MLSEESEPTHQNSYLTEKPHKPDLLSFSSKEESGMFGHRGSLKELMKQMKSRENSVNRDQL